jgi:hypothetical protein
MSGPFDGKKFTIAPAGGKEIPDFVDLDDVFAGTYQIMSNSIQLAII